MTSAVLVLVSPEYFDQGVSLHRPSCERKVRQKRKLAPLASDGLFTRGLVEERESSERDEAQTAVGAWQRRDRSLWTRSEAEVVVGQGVEVVISR